MAYGRIMGIVCVLLSSWHAHAADSRLDEVVAHFRKRVAEGPARPKIAAIAGLEALLEKAALNEGRAPDREIVRPSGASSQPRR